jgi:hypothetical protein
MGRLAPPILECGAKENSPEYNDGNGMAAPLYAVVMHYSSFRPSHGVSHYVNNGVCATASIQFWRLASCDVQLGVGGVCIRQLVGTIAPRGGQEQFQLEEDCLRFRQ